MKNHAVRYEVIVPGTTATVLSALNTRKVRKAPTFPKSIAMVIYLKQAISDRQNRPHIFENDVFYSSYY